MEEQENCETKMRGCLKNGRGHQVQEFVRKHLQELHAECEKALRVLPKALGGIG